MSGTSIDAVDAALILTDGERVLDFGPVAERKYRPQERSIIRTAVDAARAWNWSGPRPETAIRAANEVLTQTHADAWRQLIEGWNGPVPAIAGVHGQTVLHRPPTAEVSGQTLQILDASSLRSQLGVPLAYDFRSADVGAGGQGAPLAPAFHAALLQALGDTSSKAVLNLGGVANVTYRAADGKLVAFDTGPANGPIDEWMEQHGLGTHDENGRTAAAGRVDEMSIDLWMDKPWFDLPGPKSLDRFDFDATLARGMSVEDGAATLTAFSAESVAHAIRSFTDRPDQLIVCGGGRRNPQLMQELRVRAPCAVKSAEDVGWLGDSIEAQAFAFLAVRTLRGLPISWPGTTSAPAPITGGRLID
ncbi:anhydro-N-acetylmuramic acid kinase [Henriciella barbarensis]|uniref:Anhydro-N-acetylmuramic acid kinase n=2 Tax=Henriciella barbarensis TaxID=86342 RepID=A0A399R8F9_9PROT|nr:anhydro-N-acetylmuramic acid kinase [Henriciella barbarensis]